MELITKNKINKEQYPFLNFFEKSRITTLSKPEKNLFKIRYHVKFMLIQCPILKKFQNFNEFEKIKYNEQREPRKNLSMKDF